VDDEYTPELGALMQSPFKVNVSGPGDVQLPPGASADLPFTITNTGTESDSYTLTPVSNVPWSSLVSVAATVSLASGASTQFTVYATVPAGTAVGTKGNLAITAVSQNNNLLQDTAYSELKVVGGPPRIAGSVLTADKTDGGVSATVLLENQGSGPAFNIQITSITARTLSGSGTVTVADPVVPYSVGAVGAGHWGSLSISLNVPATVTRFALVENGLLQDPDGLTAAFSTSELIQP
jgi:hypothetical protein